MKICGVTLTWTQTKVLDAFNLGAGDGVRRCDCGRADPPVCIQAHQKTCDALVRKGLAHACRKSWAIGAGRDYVYLNADGQRLAAERAR